MGVKCTHYKLCSVQSKLVYFLQFWGMKHFLGPVCDIWPVVLDQVWYNKIDIVSDLFNYAPHNGK